MVLALVLQGFSASEANQSKPRNVAMKLTLSKSCICQGSQGRGSTYIHYPRHMYIMTVAIGERRVCTNNTSLNGYISRVHTGKMGSSHSLTVVKSVRYPNHEHIRQEQGQVNQLTTSVRAHSSALSKANQIPHAHF